MALTHPKGPAPPGSDLAAVASALAEEGITSERRSGVSPGVADAVVFTDPQGTEIAIFTEYAFATADGRQTGVMPIKLGHVAYRVNDVAKVVSAFGSLVAVLIVVVSTAILVAAYRRWADVIVLVVGSGLIYAAVHIAKAAIDRPRPPDPRVETSLSSFPSAHAAYATAYIAVALILTRRFGLAANAALVTVAIVLAAAIGLSRIYLRAHYWSDVAAGWGIGCGTFALLAAIAMVVNHVRHNGGQREPEHPLARVER